MANLEQGPGLESTQLGLRIELAAALPRAE
jgi:hypothetical protein